ncbi:MAG: hypothetical protein MUE44_34145 [Oscillatoriaceae cyanobacterium Prado104]|nr:hypothetical protein [Oscillatoriaceae cyanobacterium Prado104]
MPPSVRSIKCGLGCNVTAVLERQQLNRFETLDFTLSAPPIAIEIFRSHLWLAAAVKSNIFFSSLDAPIY